MTRNYKSEAYDRKYCELGFEPLVLRPNAFSTTRYDDVARMLPSGTQNATMLDVGCGDGGLLFALAERFQRAVGFDLSNVRIETARRALAERYPHLGDRVELHVGDADTPFPFVDESFDVVIACAVLEHVVHVFSVMDEIRRVCKPGGYALITVPNMSFLVHVMDLLLGRVPKSGSPTRDMAYWRKHGWDGGHLHVFTQQGLRNLMVHMGFEPEAWSGCAKWAKLRRWWLHLTGHITVLAKRTGG